MNLAGLKMLSEEQEYNSSRLSPRIIKLMKFLDQLPDSVVIDSGRLAMDASLRESFIRNLGPRPAVLAYRFVHDGRVWWGNKRTVAKVLCPKPAKPPSKR